MLKPFRVLRKHWRELSRPKLHPSPAEVALEAIVAPPAADLSHQDSALHSKIDALGSKVDALAVALEAHVRETRLLYASLAMREPGLTPNPPLIAGATPSRLALTHSQPCRQDSFLEPWFSYWTTQFHADNRHHRKLWEFVFICQSLYERGLLIEGSRGLGFGVGTEPLAALFAARGCRIVGTDMSSDAQAASGWAETQQHAAGKATMRHPRLCDDAVFDKNVDFRTCDMNAVPADLTDFDFCWSSCALEHLGSLENGLRFIERSVDCLRPGGWAIHTTEFNFGSNDETIDHMGTVLYRRRDFEALRDRLAARGHVLAPLDFDVGSGPADLYLDVPPYRQEPCLKIALMGHATTSFGLIIQKAPA